MAFGVFDGLHQGHLSYLRQAYSLGDKLYVLVANDKAVFWAKNKTPINNEEARKQKIASLPFVYEAFVGGEVKSKEDYLLPIVSVDPDILCLGYDQALDIKEWLEAEVAKLEKSPKIVRARPYKPNIYKTSLFSKDRE